MIPLRKDREERIATASVRTGFAMTGCKKYGGAGRCRHQPLRNGFIKQGAPYLAKVYTQKHHRHDGSVSVVFFYPETSLIAHQKLDSFYLYLFSISASLI